MSLGGVYCWHCETLTREFSEWNLVQESFCWFGTLFKTGPQILDPIQEMVHFSWQPAIREMNVLGRQSDFFDPQAHAMLLQYSRGLAWKSMEWIPCKDANMWTVYSRQVSLITIPYHSSTSPHEKKRWVPPEREHRWFMTILYGDLMAVHVQNAWVFVYCMLQAWEPSFIFPDALAKQIAWSQSWRSCSVSALKE